MGGHFKEKVEDDDDGTDELLSDMVGDNIGGRSVSRNSSPTSSLDTPNKVCGINVVEIVLLLEVDHKLSINREINSAR